MKRKSMLSFLFSLIIMCVLTANVNAQNDVNPRLYIVTQTSSTCTMCTDYSSSWNTNVINHYSTDPGIVFISYDISNDNTMATTRPDLDRYGIYNSLTGYNTPGSVILIDPVTKKVVGTTTMDANYSDVWKSINTYSGSPSPTK